MRISPVAALTTTLSSAVAYAFLHTQGLLIYEVSLLTILIVSQGRRSATFAGAFLKWTVPFVVPLLLIHAVLNANYAVQAWIFHTIPWRPEGFRFGMHVSFNLCLIAITGAYWLAVSRDNMTDSLFRLRLPAWLVLFFTQGLAVGSLIERRVENVYLAQRARGIAVGPGVIARLRAFPAVLLPVVVSTLVEAQNRVPALVSRGFGVVRPKPLPRRPLRAVEWGLLLSPALLLAVALTVDSLR